MSDDKTRILSAAEAARLFSRKPKVVGDKVVFYCDNGHRVVAPLRDGGKRGACSKCGTPVTVPTAVAEDAEGVTMILAAPKESRVTPSGEGMSSPGFNAALPAAVPLSGGVPADDVPPAGESAVADEAAADSADALPVAADAGADEPAAAESGDWPFAEPSASAAEEPFAVADDDEGDNPTARLVARLWVEHELGGTLELHLQDGSVIFPQSYEPRWSRGTHGLFAAAAPDGSITLTAVAWDAVQKIVVRNVKGLPDGMFE